MGSLSDGEILRGGSGARDMGLGGLKRGVSASKRSVTYMNWPGDMQSSDNQSLFSNQGKGLSRGLRAYSTASNN